MHATFSGEESVDDAEMTHSIRLAFTNQYIARFNQLLSTNTTNDGTVYRRVLVEASKLHQAFSQLHKASTEHLSIVHLCYDLATQLNKSGRNNSDDDESSITSTVYWMEQLKDLHKCRYSAHSVTDVKVLRALLQHTKLTLRTQQGWQQTTHCFI